MNVRDLIAALSKLDPNLPVGSAVLSVSGFVNAVSGVAVCTLEDGTLAASLVVEPETLGAEEARDFRTVD